MQSPEIDCALASLPGSGIVSHKQKSAHHMMHARLWQQLQPHLMPAPALHVTVLQCMACQSPSSAGPLPGYAMPTRKHSRVAA